MMEKKNYLKYSFGFQNHNIIPLLENDRCDLKALKHIWREDVYTYWNQTSITLYEDNRKILKNSQNK